MAAAPDKPNGWLTRLIAAIERVHTDGRQATATEVEALIDHLRQPTKSQAAPSRDAA